MVATWSRVLQERCADGTLDNVEVVVFLPTESSAVRDVYTSRFEIRGTDWHMAEEVTATDEIESMWECLMLLGDTLRDARDGGRELRWLGINFLGLESP